MLGYVQKSKKSTLQKFHSVLLWLCFNAHYSEYVREEIRIFTEQELKYIISWIEFLYPHKVRRLYIFETKMKQFRFTLVVWLYHINGTNL